MRKGQALKAGAKEANPATALGIGFELVSAVCPLNYPLDVVLLQRQSFGNPVSVGLYNALDRWMSLTKLRIKSTTHGCFWRTRDLSL